MDPFAPGMKQSRVPLSVVFVCGLYVCIGRQASFMIEVVGQTAPIIHALVFEASANSCMQHEYGRVVWGQH